MDTFANLYTKRLVNDIANQLATFPSSYKVQSEILYNLSQSRKIIRQRSRASTRRARSIAKARRGDVLKPFKSCPQGSSYLLIHFENSS